MILQTALIVGPLGVLSGVAFYFLREDKAAVEQDARDRAAAIIPELARRTGEGVGKMLSLATEPPPKFEGIVAGGKITSPPDYPRVPEPPDWPDEAGSRAGGILEQLQEALYNPAGARKGPAAHPESGNNAAFEAMPYNEVAALRALASAGSPPELRANAAYALLLRRVRTDVVAAGRGAGQGVARNTFGIGSSSLGPGSPRCAPRAGLRRSILGLLGELAESVHRYPSILTPDLLDAAEKVAKPDAVNKVRSLRTEWANREKARGLLRSLLDHGLSYSNPSETWLDSAGMPVSGSDRSGG